MKVLKGGKVELVYTGADGHYVRHYIDSIWSDYHEWRATLECEGHKGQQVFVDLSNQGTEEGLEHIRGKIRRLKKEGSPHGNRYYLIKPPFLATVKGKRESSTVQ